MLPPDSTLNYTLQARHVKKDRESTFSVLAVGANCVRPRAFTERPYEDDFLSVGITCFMEDAPWRVDFYYICCSDKTSVVFLDGK